VKCGIVFVLRKLPLTIRDGIVGQLTIRRGNSSVVE